MSTCEIKKIQHFHPSLMISLITTVAWKMACCVHKLQWKTVIRTLYAVRAHCLMYCLFMISVNGATLHCVRKKGATLFSTITVAILGRFFIIFAPMETSINTPHSHVIYLLNSLMTFDVITVTRHKSWQYNFTLHVNINHIEFEDKLLIKPMKM